MLTNLISNDITKFHQHIRGKKQTRSYQIKVESKLQTYDSFFNACTGVLI